MRRVANPARTHHALSLSHTIIPGTRVRRPLLDRLMASSLGCQADLKSSGVAGQWTVQEGCVCSDKNEFTHLYTMVLHPDGKYAVYALRPHWLARSCQRYDALPRLPTVCPHRICMD